MSDLVERLRDLGDRAGYEPHMHHAAADRIEELEADLRSAEISEAFWRAGWRALDQDKRSVDAKLAKAVEALEKVQDFVRDLAPYADQRHTLVPALREACEALIELKGEGR